MIFFTSDLHLGHANIIKHCNRPFSSVEEMDEHLLSAWNSRVRPNDTVYILGDLIFRSKVPVDSYLSRLRGKKHLIIGNHDKGWMKKTDMSEHFVSVERFAEISDGQHKMTLCHYPLMSWNHIAKGSYMIHGHIHNSRDAMYFPLMRQMPNLLNAGVEINGYHPVKLDELIRNNEVFKSECREVDTFSEVANGIDALAGRMHGLAEQALCGYTPIAEDIMAGRIVGERDIGYQLDFMLDFCWDEKVLALYKQILHSLCDKYPKLVSDYTQGYIELWGRDETTQAHENDNEEW